MNSATDAASSGERLNVNRALRALARAAGVDAAFTVVTFVDVFLVDGAGFLAGFRAVEPADFLVAMDISLLYIEIWLQYTIEHLKRNATMMVMALFMNQETERTELQKRIAAELAEKAKKKSLESSDDRPDGVSDSAYLEQTKRTTSLAWVWILIAVVAVGILVWLVVISA
jgi:hypothetical protein